MKRDDDRDSNQGPMPVSFAAHGAPILLDDPEWMHGAFTKRSVQFG